MNTFGTIHKVYHNGRISYVGSEARADGVPLDDEVVNGVIADDWSDDEDGNHYEEAVIGMGFDYESDESRGTDLGQYTYACLQESERNRDDFDALTEVNATLIKGGDNFCRSEIVRSNGESVALNANHQSRDCRQCIVDVVAGQSLYIPAGWFHEVTSFSNDNTIRGSKVISLAARDDSNSQFSATAKIDRIKDDNGGDGFDGCHVAINYWYHPPDQLENFRNPYCSNFWREHTAMPP